MFRLLPVMLLAGLVLAAPPARPADVVQATAAAHATDRPEASPAATTAPARPVTGMSVAYGQAGDQPINGYLARPADAGPGTPGLIVIHEWWGLNDNIRQVTERLAGEGYVALAVDLYGGKAASEPKDAMALMQRLQGQVDEANANLRQAYAYLTDTAGAPRVGVVGWCLGGQWSLRTALLLPADIDATVIYYGSVPTDAATLAPLEMPILGNFAENDPIIPPATVKAFAATLEELGKTADIKIYPGAQHAFSNPSGTAYDAAAAADAWQRTTAFFRRYLRP